MNTRDKGGFTLVEVLVVIAIIGVLIALLLPALQAARESARQTTCRSNLRQLGMAIQSYESQHKNLPPGGVWQPNSRVKRGSIFAYLLPFIEQVNLYDALDFTRNDLDVQTLAADGALVGSIAIEVLRCPSDGDIEDFNPTRALHNYAASRGPTALWPNPNCLCTHEWESLAIAPVDDPNNFAGPFTRVGTTARLAQITDGLSRTIFVGEVRPACSEHARNGWIASNNGSGYSSTIIPINYDTCGETAVDPCRRSCNWTTEAGFKSHHAGGANFLFGDGSVTFVSESIDMTLYQHLGAQSDGSTVNRPI